MSVSCTFFPCFTFLCITKCVTAAEREGSAGTGASQKIQYSTHIWMATSRISREEYYNVYLIPEIHSKNFWVKFCEQWKKGRVMLTSQNL